MFHAHLPSTPMFDQSTVRPSTLLDALDDSLRSEAPVCANCGVPVLKPTATMFCTPSCEQTAFAEARCWGCGAVADLGPDGYCSTDCRELTERTTWNHTPGLVSFCLPARRASGNPDDLPW